MTDEQIRLYAACRVVCPSSMIRLRSLSEGGRLCVVATRQEFRTPIMLGWQRLFDHELHVVHHPFETAGVSVARFAAWDVGEEVYIEAAAILAREILRHWRDPRLNVRL